MCGIVGYVGKSPVIPILVDGLSKLEYRGYDSAGVAYIEKGKVLIQKNKGRLENLENVLKDMDIKSTVGIGHTRWATHGKPSELNAHPHSNNSGSIAVIHNGIIENYMKLKEWLEQENGSVFLSETDTEVIAHLVDYYYHGDLMDAVYKAVDKMRGAYAIGVICSEEPDKMVAVRKDSPLIVGLGTDGNLIASDIPALLKYTRDVYMIENDEVILLKADYVQIFDALGNEIKREPFKVTWDVESAEKEGFEHFTIKEIFEQPKGIRETFSRRYSDGVLDIEGLNLTEEYLRGIDRINIVACGTAYHAGLIGKKLIEDIVGIPVDIDIASEYRYRCPFVNEKVLFIAVSQSGETIDTLKSMREAKRKGARVLSICNVVGSSVARDSDDVFYTWAGPEIGVASTKAYTTQLTAFYLLAIKMGMLLGVVDDKRFAELMDDLAKVPEQIQQILENEGMIQKLAYEEHMNEHIFFIGRERDLDTAFEASLKLKEISYINTFAVAAGELKHGTIALVEDNTMVFAIATQKHLYEKMMSNIKEVKARGAHVVAVVMEDGEGADNGDLRKVVDHVITIPRNNAFLIPILSIIPFQLFAYYVSVARGNDVDKPRNLAKSVTVE